MRKCGFVLAPLLVTILMVITVATGSFIWNKNLLQQPNKPSQTKQDKPVEKSNTNSDKATPSSQLTKKSPTIPTPTPSPTPTPTLVNPTANQNLGSIVIDKTHVTVSLYKDQAANGLVFGTGFKIVSTGATGWQIKYNESTSGQGFYESSGGISPNGSTDIRAYINADKPNGIYTGSTVVQYYKNSVWSDGPTVNYTITLVGPATASMPTPTPTPTTVPTASPTPTPSANGCTPVTFSTSKSGSTTTVAVGGAWNLSVKSTPEYDSVDFDTTNRIIYLRFSAASGNINVYTANYTSAPLCQSYNFGG